MHRCLAQMLYCTAHACLVPMVPEKKSTKSPGMGITMVVICHECAGNPNSGPLEEQQSSHLSSPRVLVLLSMEREKQKQKQAGVCAVNLYSQYFGIPKFRVSLSYTMTCRNATQENMAGLQLSGRVFA